MKEVIEKCKCGVYLEVNKHRDYHNTIEQGIRDENSLIEPNLADRMIKENMLISLQFYPDTPIGFYKVYGTSIDEVVEKALSILNQTKIK